MTPLRTIDRIIFGTTVFLWFAGAVLALRGIMLVLEWVLS